MKGLSSFECQHALGIRLIHSIQSNPIGQTNDKTAGANLTRFEFKSANRERIDSLLNCTYKVLPPFSSECSKTNNSEVMKLIYPKKISRIHIPVNLNGELEKVSFEATHRRKEEVVFWHIDEEFVGSPQNIHQIMKNR